MFGMGSHQFNSGSNFSFGYFPFGFSAHFSSHNNVHNQSNRSNNSYQSRPRTQEEFNYEASKMIAILLSLMIILLLGGYV